MAEVIEAFDDSARMMWIFWGAGGVAPARHGDRSWKEAVTAANGAVKMAKLIVGPQTR